MGIRDRMREVQQISSEIPRSSSRKTKARHRQTPHARRTPKIEKTTRKRTPPPEITAHKPRRTAHGACLLQRPLSFCARPSLPCPGMSTTPMMKQYQDAKAACGDAILLFRMGDFYEMFLDDAQTAARTLGLALTSRDKGENPIPMAGFPHHQLENYLGKLVAAGLRVAICDQTEDPKQAKGLVRREVTRIVSAGTLTDAALLGSAARAIIWRPSSAGEPGGSGLGRAFHRPIPRRLFSAAAIGRSTGPHRSGRMLVGRRAPICSRPPAGRQVVTRRPPWAFGHDGGRAIARQTFRHGEPRRISVSIHAVRWPGVGRRRRDSRLSHRNAKKLARASRSADPLSRRANAGTRRIDAPQPGNHAARSATAAAKVRCWPRSIARRPRWARARWPNGWPIRWPIWRRSTSARKRSPSSSPTPGLCDDLREPACKKFTICSGCWPA